MALLVTNAKILDIKKITLFLTNLRKKSNLFKRLRDNRLAQSAINKIGILKHIYKNILKIQEKFIYYQNYKKNDILAK